MSKGPGRIERAIRELFDAHSDLAFVTDELAEHCFPEADKVERKHQVTVLRAAWNVIDADPDWSAWRISGQGQGWVFANKANLQSYALCRMITRSGFVYRSEKRARRRGWWNKPDTREDLLARLRPGSVNDTFLKEVQPDGRWARAVESHCARRAGDVERADRIAGELEYERATYACALGVRPADLGIDEDLVKRFLMGNVDGNETHTEISPPDDGVISTEETRNCVSERLADKARALIRQNDPDAVRAGLEEIAAALDALRQPHPEQAVA